jgi:hypothetical protein
MLSGVQVRRRIGAQKIFVERKTAGKAAQADLAGRSRQIRLGHEAFELLLRWQHPRRNPGTDGVAQARSVGRTDRRGQGPERHAHGKPSSATQRTRSGP